MANLERRLHYWVFVNGRYLLACGIAKGTIDPLREAPITCKRCLDLLARKAAADRLSFKNGETNDV